MKIFNFFSHKKKEKRFILGILFKEEESQVIIFEKNTTEISFKMREKLISNLYSSNLIYELDEILAKIEKKFQGEVNEVIFFVYSHFIDEKSSELKKNVLDLIKDLVKNLDLKPLGYIEVVETLSSYFTYQDKVPFTSAVIELDKSYLTFLIYKGGNIFLKKTIEKSTNIINDLLTILNQKENNFLVPTRFILYDGNEIDDCCLKIINYQWPEKIFIQTPKIEILKAENLIKAFVYILNKQLINKKITIEKSDLYSKNDFGFVIGKDIKKEKQKEYKNKENTFVENENKNNLEKEKAVGKIIKNKLKKFYLNFIQPPINIISNKISSKFVMFLFAIFIFLLLIINEYFFHQVEIIINPSIKTLEQNFVIDNQYIFATFSARLKSEKNTTGKKLIGEKARGKIIIYNTNLNKEKIIKKGTKIDFDGLGYFLNEEVKIASAQSATLPGSIKTEVTAEEIGEEYNISKGKKFIIDDNSYAETLENFIGGSKKEIRTISQLDIKELEELILKKAKEEKIEEKQKENNRILINSLRKVSMKEKKVSGEIGQEAEKVTIEGEVVITDFYINKDDLFKNIVNKLKPNIDKDYFIDKEETKYQIKKAEIINSKIRLELLAKIVLVKEINLDVLKSKIKFKPIGFLDQLLKEEYQLANYEIKTKNYLPIFNNFFPLFKKNIVIKKIKKV